MAPAHRAGDTVAATNIALTHRQLGDRRMMLTWLRRGITRGDCYAAIWLAKVYLFERATEAQRAEGLQLREGAARSDDVEAEDAMRVLADVHEQRRGVPASVKQAARWRARADRRLQKEIARGRIVDA